MDTVVVPAGTYTLSIAGIGEDAAASGDLEIIDDLTLIGDGPGITIIDGGGLDRVFHLPAGLNQVVEISGVTIQNGNAGNDWGGGILNDGVLTLTNSAVINNDSGQGGGGILNGDGELHLLTIDNSTIRGNTTDMSGGGIYNHFGATMNITDSTISGNDATVAGGGIVNDGGTLTLTESTISDNTSNLHGGGIANEGTVTITDSTISGNSAEDQGGGILHRSGTMTLTNSTVTVNTSQTKGGGIDQEDYGTVTMVNTIFANNSPGNCGPYSITSLGFNLDSDGTCRLGDPTDLTGDPILDGLQDNGGSTLTHSLLPGSPAVDHIPGECSDAEGNPVDTDQRGVARPSGLGCDIGAYEYDGPTANLLIMKEVSNANPSVWDQITYTVRVENNGPDPAEEVLIIDRLPEGLKFVWASDQGYDPTTGEWYAGPTTTVAWSTVPSASTSELSRTTTKPSASIPSSPRPTTLGVLPTGRLVNTSGPSRTWTRPSALIPRMLRPTTTVAGPTMTSVNTSGPSRTTTKRSASTPSWPRPTTTVAWPTMASVSTSVLSRT